MIANKDGQLGTFGWQISNVIEALLSYYNVIHSYNYDGLFQANKVVYKKHLCNTAVEQTSPHRKPVYLIFHSVHLCIIITVYKD